MTEIMTEVAPIPNIQKLLNDPAFRRPEENKEV